MEKNTGRKNVIGTIIAVLVTLLVYFLLSIGELQHYLMFLIPVPFAVYILKYGYRSFIPAAFITLLIGSFIDFHILKALFTGAPIDSMYILRGFLFLLLSFVISFIHGYLPSTGMTPIKEMSLVILADFVNGLVLTLIFLNLKDSIIHSTHHYTESIMNLFKVNHESVLFHNFVGIGSNLDFGYLVFVAGLEAVYTHIIVHHVFIRLDNRDKNHTFSGLDVQVPRKITFTYFVITTITFTSFFFVKGNMSDLVMAVYGVAFNVIMGLAVFYLYQGIIFFFHVFAVISEKRLSLVAFALGILIAPITIVIGMLDSIFYYSIKLSPRIKSELTTFVVQTHSRHWK